VPVTIKQIAGWAGVSSATVSKILNGKDTFISNETRERVWSLVREHNYRPNSIARSLVRRRTNMIGIIVADILNPYYAELVRACDDAARSRGYSTIVCNSDDDPSKEGASLDFLSGHGVDGIVLAVSAIAPDPKQLDSLGVPIATMDRDIPELECVVATVDTAYLTGAYLSARHLIDGGHKRIAFLSGSAEASNTRARLAGFRKAHEEAGLMVDPALILCGEFQHSFGYEGTLGLLGQTEFTALCCMSDMLAIGACAALRERGKTIPSDCAVMGFDNIYLAGLLERPLSTVDRRIFESGQTAVNALIDYLGDPSRQRVSVIIEPTILERATT
jgi:LacI family transcriptional regulator